jgi:hypothetical protein
MTHIKYPNELGPPVIHERNWQTPMPQEKNWQEEAMRQNAMLHVAMTGGVEAEARAAKFELERDALLRVVVDNHVALTRAEDAEAKAEDAEAKLALAIEALDEAIYLLDPDEEDMAQEAGLYRIVTARAKLEKTE